MVKKLYVPRIMCQELTQGTICNNNTKGYFTCECPIFKYFNIKSNACEDELTKNEECKYTNECQTDKGLTCINGYCE